MKKLEALICKNALGESVTFSDADTFCPKEVAKVHFAGSFFPATFKESVDTICAGRNE